MDDLSDEKIDAAFAKVLYKLRTKRHLTQDELGVDRSYVSILEGPRKEGWQRGSKGASVRTLVRFCRLRLKVSSASFMALLEEALDDKNFLDD